MRLLTAVHGIILKVTKELSAEALGLTILVQYVHRLDLGVPHVTVIANTASAALRIR